MLKNTALAIVALVIGILLLEVASCAVLKVRGQGRYESRRVPQPYHPYLAWEQAPDAEYPWTRCGGKFGGVVKTDANGRAITPHYAHASPDITVAVLGGSTMFGIGASDNEHSVPSSLEKIINERAGINAEVINLSVGFQSFQEALNLQRFLIEGDAKIVLSVSGRNDAWHAARQQHPRSSMLPDEVYPKAEFVRSVENERLTSLRVGTELLVRKLRAKSYTAELLQQALFFRRPTRSFGTEEPDENTLTQDFANIEQRARASTTNYSVMAAVAEANGARFVMFLQPTAFTKESLTPAEKECISLARPFMGFYSQYEPKFYERFASYPKTFEWHDISGCLSDFEGDAYIDVCHYTEDAAYVIAESIYEIIEPLLVRADSNKLH